MISPGLFGGILLICGAYALYEGKVFYSIILYFIADLMWLALAIKVQDYIGAFLISIGMLLGVGVYIKMNSGVFVKDLKKESDD